MKRDIVACATGGGSVQAGIIRHRGGYGERARYHYVIGDGGGLTDGRAALLGGMILPVRRIAGYTGSLVVWNRRSNKSRWSGRFLLLGGCGTRRARHVSIFASRAYLVDIEHGAMTGVVVAS